MHDQRGRKIIVLKTKKWLYKENMCIRSEITAKSGIHEEIYDTYN